MSAVADRIAYVNHDIDDAIRAGVLEEKNLPESTHAVLGSGHSARIETLVTDAVVRFCGGGRYTTERFGLCCHGGVA